MSERIKIKKSRGECDLSAHASVSQEGRIKKAAEEANLSITAWLTIAIADEIYR